MLMYGVKKGDRFLTNEGSFSKKLTPDTWMEKSKKTATGVAADWKATMATLNVLIEEAEAETTG